MTPILKYLIFTKSSCARVPYAQNELKKKGGGEMKMFHVMHWHPGLEKLNFRNIDSHDDPGSSEVLPHRLQEGAGQQSPLR